MGRVVNTDSAGAERSRLRRTIAEALRLLGQKQAIDDEARDPVALIVYSLRGIAQGVDASAAAGRSETISSRQTASPKSVSYGAYARFALH